MPEIMLLFSIVISYFIKIYFKLSTVMYIGLIFLLLFMFSEKN